ncbi:hypothetical protein DPMN_179853 [Dreissena polymorpha]|uniref:Uncharacterized protein n=1 Tax=Dreissena polymorpha TaxID=45954 RepID=A0A9D4EES7_DREPO|nr:hypothetical protein DPMN_179853 [Dreissena polymorpha]
MLMELLVCNLFSLAIPAVTIAILSRTSAVLKPSMDRVAPKYLKLVTCFSCSQCDLCTGVGRAVHHDLRLLCADLLPVCSCYFMLVRS